ncbi:hypothetical protein Pam3_72 [Pseudanabaena phage Pam3]|nr:hypothetical protein Pam3_72 [Pseudanabaena phage Pam3]
MTLLEVSASTHQDIRNRIAALGPIYTADFFRESREHGLIIVFGEVGLVVERPRG